jgi:hypothetical protein
MSPTCVASTADANLRSVDGRRITLKESSRRTKGEYP